MHSKFTPYYSIFYNGDLSGEIKWIDRHNPQKEHIIPEDVVKMIKNICLEQLADVLHDKLIDAMWEEI